MFYIYEMEWVERNSHILNFFTENPLPPLYGRAAPLNSVIPSHYLLWFVLFHEMNLGLFRRCAGDFDSACASLCTGSIEDLAQILLQTGTCMQDVEAIILRGREGTLRVYPVSRRLSIAILFNVVSWNS
jgi:hypothetical protein